MKNIVIFLISFFCLSHQIFSASRFNVSTSGKIKSTRATVAKSEDSWLPATKELFYAVESPNFVRVVSAIADGADVNARDNDGYTPLIRAKNGSQAEIIVPILIKAGADVNVQDKHGLTALFHFICPYKAEVELARIILEAGADINIVSKGGNTPLMRALKCRGKSKFKERQEGMIRMLLAYGADPDHYNNLGKTDRDINQLLTDKAILANREEAIIKKREQLFLFSKFVSNFHEKSMGCANGPVLHAIIKLDFGQPQHLTAIERFEFNHLKKRKILSLF